MEAGYSDDTRHTTDKVFRRIKELVDMYYFSKVIDFDKAEVIQTLQKSGKVLDTFAAFLHRSDELKHAYDKFRFTENVDKSPFDEVYRAVKG